MDDDLNDPGGETYATDGCSEPVRSLDQWNDGSFHCSRCGRSTVVVDGERVHKPAGKT